jgi:putative heme-binding domain-containing protein
MKRIHLIVIGLYCAQIFGLISVLTSVLAAQPPQADVSTPAGRQTAQRAAAKTPARANGDAAAGVSLFNGKGACATCHSIDNRGASLGPDLEEIGVTRSVKSLRLALTDPDAEIFPEYYTLIVETKSGETVRGLTLNEDDLSIQIRDINGTPRSFLKDDIKSSRREVRSLMPSYTSRLSAAEIEDVVAYLRTLQGDAPAKRMKRTR